MRVTHFYHVYAGNGDHWRDPLAEHLASLEDFGFDGEFRVGIVGPPESREQVRNELHWIRQPDSIIEADVGWEQFTLHWLHKFVHEQPPRIPHAILYMHTKGAATPVDIQVPWRQSMTYDLLLDWRKCASRLSSKYDAVGGHWLTPRQFPANQIPSPFFGGNFWMASVKYLSRLPVCAETNRWDAELWIGLKNPKIWDLHPGPDGKSVWPGSVPYTRFKARRLIAAAPAL